ncbi:MAG: zinc-binding dehydrogenase [Ectothiorhodospiraceae bacterium]|nr:zinc-binding dehydrogenase [Chromatiales bacterium]MCP5153712.1 zinc-binding dehydrogenase [Ectothiorhodospiraceae bacterium]
MRRVVIDRPGGHDRLRVVTAPDLVPAPDRVLIDVDAVGVNYADCVVRMGLYASANRMVGFPITPGFEVAGRVRAVEPGPHGLVPGDRVMGLTLFDAYASQILLPPERVMAIPPGMSTIEAATFPAVWVTAWFALELAAPPPGSDVLVHSAAGGVGSALVHLARLAGCRVVGVVGAPHKVEAARAAGAEVVIDKSSEALWPAAEAAAPGRFHAVLDANGVSTLMQSYRHLAPTGRLVVYGFHGMLPRRGGRPNRLRLLWDWLRTPRFDPLRMTTSNRSVMAFNLSFLAHEGDRLRIGLEHVVGLYRDGRIPALPVTTYPFESVARAHADLESGRTVGKLALVLDRE